MTNPGEAGDAGFVTVSGAVIVDLRAVQSPNYRGRGIARRAYEEAAGLERVRPDLVGAYVLDPTWPPPGPLDDLLVSGKLCYLGTPQARAALERATVYHCGSPFELDRTIAQVRPPEVDRHGLRYAATLHDLIPLVRREHYLAHPAQRRRYMARLEVLRSADAVLAVSESAAADGFRLLELDGRRLHVVGSGVSTRFVPPGSRAGALARTTRLVSELAGPFIVVPGGNDPRKNTEMVLAAYAALPPAVGRRLQLVVTGELPEAVAAHYRHVARQAGIGERLVLTGFVPDETLVQLYQATALVVFPSLAEGFGLPVAEGLACGAVACVSDRSPLDELVPDARARFDPEDKADMAAAMERCLTDASVAEAVRADAASTVASWDTVAGRVATVLEGLARQPRRPWRSTRRVAVVAPFPPVPTRTARYCAELVSAMERVTSAADDADRPPGARVEIDCFVDGRGRSRGRSRAEPEAEPEPEPEAVCGNRPREASAFLGTDGAIGGYDHVLYVLGDSEDHGGALAALHRRPGMVLAMDVRLRGLLASSPYLHGVGAGSLDATIARAYPGLPAGVGWTGAVPERDAERYGLFLVTDVAAHAEQVQVLSESARDLAVLDAGSVLAARIGVVPYAVAQLSDEELATVDSARRARDAEGPGRRAIVSTFDLADAAVRAEVVVEAVAGLVAGGHDVDCQLVGAAPPSVRRRLTEVARALGVAERVHLDGDVDRGRLLQLLGETDVAVQLRDRSDGECPGALGDCLAAGVATVVTGSGWSGEVPRDVVEPVPRGCDASVMARAVGGLLGSAARRSAMGRRARTWAADRTFAAAAGALLRAMETVPEDTRGAPLAVAGRRSGENTAR